MVVLMENLFKKYTLLSILVIYPISLMGTDSIEGRWIIPLYEGDPGNTMYEFLDGLRYTYYCVDENGCDSTYWNSLDTSDALPTINPYTVDDSTLSIDLHFGNIATYTMDFRCDGEVVDFYYDDDSWEGLHSTMFRVGYDVDDCVEQQLSIPSGISLPETFRLHQNYPNPFNPITNLKYELPDDAHVSIIIYDILGNVVNNLVNTNQSSGYKTVQWNGINNQGQSVSGGVYLYCIEADNFRQTRKMILLK